MITFRVTFPDGSTELWDMPIDDTRIMCVDASVQSGELLSAEIIRVVYNP